MLATGNAAATLLYNRLLTLIRQCNMQNSILLSDAQVRPAGISVEEGIHTLKCEIKKLAKTKSETFSYICGETVTYGEVVLTMVGFAALMAVVMIGGFIFGGEVA